LSQPRFVRDTAGFAFSQYLSRFVQLLRGVVAARLLTPATYGSWNALLLILDYGLLSQLGLQQGLDQEIPGSLAKGDETATRQLKTGGVAGMMALWIVFALGITVYMVMKPRQWARGWGLPGVLLMVLAVLLQELIFYHGTLLRSHGRIGMVSKALSLQAVVGGLAGLALVKPFGAWGLLVGWLLGQLVALLFLRREGRGIAPFVLVPNAGTKQLLARGFPIFLFMATSLVLRTVDRLMILKFLTTEDLGYYSIGLMAVSMLLYIPDSVSYVLYPRLIARFSATGDADLTVRDAVRPLAAVAWIMPFLVGVSVFWMRPLVGLILPRYLPGVPALSVLLFGTLGLALASIPSFYIMAIQKQVRLVPLGIGAIVLDLGLIASFLSMGYGIVGVAIAVSVGYIVYGVGLVSYAVSHFAEPLRLRVAFVARTLLPTAWTAALCFALLVYVRPRLPMTWSPWLVAPALSLVFCLFYVAAARRLRPRTGLLGLLRGSEWPLARMLAGAWARD
jgi:O-antigen/teichoic acid export membrane protein